MASGDRISCLQFAQYVVSQEPYYDKQILKDIRPAFSDLVGFFQSQPYDAFTSNSHTFDKMRSVYPDTTRPWTASAGSVSPDGSSVDCTGYPCDPDSNQIGMGFSRYTYQLLNQSWETQLLCYDAIMSRTQAKEHYRQFIEDVLRPASMAINSSFITRNAWELSEQQISVQTGMPSFTHTWDSGGYVYMTTNQDPTGRLTPDIIRSYIQPQYMMGAIGAGKDYYDQLQLMTDIDSFHYLAKQDPVLQTAWRFGEFEPASKEYYKYGLRGFVGDFKVKCLQAPMRFNQLSPGRYQQVLPYKNISATEGIRSIFNTDFQNAQYQISLITHPKMMTVMPFVPGQVNSEMPFLLRDFAGKWKFGMHDLGADCNGRPINNIRGNKGKFFADFRTAVKPGFPEWGIALFHRVDKPCITIVAPCNPNPGYPAQSYNSANATCPSVFEFDATANGAGHYIIAANTIRVDGNAFTQAAVDQTTLAGLVTALQAIWTTASYAGTWAVGDGLVHDGVVQDLTLSGSTFNTVSIPFVV